MNDDRPFTEKIDGTHALIIGGFTAANKSYQFQNRRFFAAINFSKTIQNSSAHSKAKHSNHDVKKE